PRIVYAHRAVLDDFEFELDVELADFPEVAVPVGTNAAPESAVEERVGADLLCEGRSLLPPDVVILHADTHANSEVVVGGLEGESALPPAAGYPAEFFVANFDNLGFIRLRLFFLLLLHFLFGEVAVDELLNVLGGQAALR